MCADFGSVSCRAPWNTSTDRRRSERRRVLTYLGTTSSLIARSRRDRVSTSTGLVGVLRAQRAQQAKERLAADFYEETVTSSRPAGGPYHPSTCHAARPLQRGARPTRLTLTGSGTLAQRSCSPMRGTEGRTERSGIRSVAVHESLQSLTRRCSEKRPTRSGRAVRLRLRT